MQATREFIDRCFYIDPQTDPETWGAAWDGLKKDGINSGMFQPAACQCPLTGEVWQYMGSYRKPTGTVHEFRHRHHPAVNRRATVRVFLPTP